MDARLRNLAIKGLCRHNIPSRAGTRRRQGFYGYATRIVRTPKQSNYFKCRSASGPGNDLQVALFP